MLKLFSHGCTELLEEVVSTSLQDIKDTVVYVVLHLVLLNRTNKGPEITIKDVRVLHN